MSREAFNALLKQLEEPPPNVLYILVTTQPERVIQTVISRLMWFEFRALSTKSIVARLRHVADCEGYDLDDELCGRIAEYADGGMRDALMILEQLVIADDLTIEGFESLVGTISDELCASIIRLANDKDFVALSSFVEEKARGIGVNPLVEGITRMLVKVLRSYLGATGGTLEEELAEELSQHQIISLLKTMWDVRKMRRGRGQDRLTLQLALALLCGDATPQKVTAKKGNKLTDEQVTKMFD
jgi:DNA polymerase-3 subunit gamma/tau